MGCLKLVCLPCSQVKGETRQEVEATRAISTLLVKTYHVLVMLGNAQDL